MGSADGVPKERPRRPQVQSAGFLECEARVGRSSSNLSRLGRYSPRRDQMAILFATLHESAIGPKQTSTSAPHMSAFGGKADMTLCGCPLFRSLLGAKRTCPFALHTSAYDPKRT